MSTDGTGSRAKEIFLDALERQGAEREAWVAEACGGDESLRARVAELLAAHDSSDRVLGNATPALAQVIDLGPGDEVGPYVLGERLGEGGFGVVFRAEQREPVRRAVAVKIVKLGMDTRAVIARFEAERQALALMDHPSIARVFDAGSTEAGRPYFAMELVEGIPITEYCAKNELGTKARLDLFRTVCLAVQHAHQKGIVHRDLKPSNVLVAELDGSPVPKVIDFGIAKATGEALTEKTFFSTQGQLVGTPAYMSPEQAAGDKDVDTRTDVYALGVLLYELLAGRPPFDVRELGFLELVRAIQEIDPPRPGAQRRKALAAKEQLDTGLARLDVPADLDWVVMRCLEKDRTRRYPTAFALALDVERFLDDRPVEAAPPGVGYRLAKLARRHRAATAAGALALLSLLLGVIGTTAGMLEAKAVNEELGVVNAELEEALQLARDESERARQAELHAADEAREARRQEGIARAVNAFLNEDLLGAASPFEGDLGYDVTVRDALDAAARKIAEGARSGGRFADAPLVEAAIRYTLAQTYVDLEEFAATLSHLERCVELRRRELGPEDEETLEAESLLAGSLRRVGRLEEAETLALRVLEAQRRTRGRDAADTISTVRHLARTWADQGRVAEAVELCDEVLRDDLHDEEDAVLISLVENLGAICAKSGDFERAEELFRRVLDYRRRTLSEDSPETAGAIMNLAQLYSQRARSDLAEPLFREALAVQEARLGPEHPATIEIMLGLGFSWMAMGRFPQAEEIYARAFELAEGRHGPRHPLTLRTATQLAKARGLLGRFDEAEELLRGALTGYRETVGADDERTVRAARDLALVLAQRERYDEAREVLEEVLDAQVASVGASHPDSLLTLLALARIARSSGDDETAERLMRHGLDVTLERYGTAEHWGVSFASGLAELLNRGGRHEEALEFARDAEQWSRTASSPKSFDRVVCLHELGRALARLGRPAEAEPFLREGVEITTERFSGIQTHGYLMVELAAVYRALGRDAEAEPLEERIEALRRPRGGGASDR